MWWIFWLAIALILSLAKCMYGGLILLWFSIGALAALSTSFFTTNLSIQSLVFLITSVSLLLLLNRRIARKFQRKIQSPIHIDDLLKHKAIVVKAIGPNTITGLVKLDGEIWTALSSNDTFIEKGTPVIIDEIKGIRVFVSQIKK